MILAIVGATFFVIIRLNSDVNKQEEYDESMAEKLAADLVAAGREGANDDGESSPTRSYRFSFLVGYAIELVVALFIFYFFTSTVFFSGLLGCGRIPILGGRPYELWREKIRDKNKKSNDANDNETNDKDKSEMDQLSPGLVAYWA